MQRQRHTGSACPLTGRYSRPARRCTQSAGCWWRPAPTRCRYAPPASACSAAAPGPNNGVCGLRMPSADACHLHPVAAPCTAASSGAPGKGTGGSGKGDCSENSEHEGTCGSVLLFWRQAGMCTCVHASCAAAHRHTAAATSVDNTHAHKCATNAGQMRHKRATNAHLMLSACPLSCMTDCPVRTSTSDTDACSSSRCTLSGIQHTCEASEQAAADPHAAAGKAGAAGNEGAPQWSRRPAACHPRSCQGRTPSCAALLQERRHSSDPACRWAGGQQLPTVGDI